MKNIIIGVAVETQAGRKDVLVFAWGDGQDAPNLTVTKRCEGEGIGDYPDLHEKAGVHEIDTYCEGIGFKGHIAGYFHASDVSGSDGDTLVARVYGSWPTGSITENRPDTSRELTSIVLNEGVAAAAQWVEDNEIPEWPEDPEVVAERERQAKAEAERLAKEAEAAEALAKRKGYARASGEVYYSQPFNGSSDVEAIGSAYMHTACNPTRGAFILLEGPPGAGKTALIDAALTAVVARLLAAAATEKEKQAITVKFSGQAFFEVVGTNQTRVEDLIGGWVKVGNDFKFQLRPVGRAMAEGKPVFIDEIAQINPKELVAVYAGMDGRTSLDLTSLGAPDDFTYTPGDEPSEGQVEQPDPLVRNARLVVAPGFYVIGAYNKNVPGAILSEALISRFTTPIDVYTDYAMARSLGVDSKVCDAAENLAKKVSQDEATMAPQMRQLLAFTTNQTLFGDDIAWGALLNTMSKLSPMDAELYLDVFSRFAGKVVSVPSLGGVR